jgi:hypothetical protein
LLLARVARVARGLQRIARVHLGAIQYLEPSPQLEVAEQDQAEMPLQQKVLKMEAQAAAAASMAHQLERLALERLGKVMRAALRHLQILQLLELVVVEALEQLDKPELPSKEEMVA